MTEAEFRSGRIAIVGRTNAGKSTLLNRLVGEKVAIASRVPQTTRQLVVGILNEPNAQLVFVDTPGVHAPRFELNRRMLDQTREALSSVEAVVHLIDASERMGKGDAFAARLLREAGPPWVIALNKVDRVRPKTRLLPMIERLHLEGGARAVVPVSARDGTGVPGLLQELHALLPVAPPIHPTDLTTDQSEMFYVSELIREKVLHATREEVPHATAVFVESLEQKARATGRDALVVQAVIAVEKDNQKGILIGRAGSMLKRIGTAARKDIERQLSVSCHLDLFVKVLPRWRDDSRVLARVLADPRAGMRADGLPTPAELAGPPHGAEVVAES